MGSSGGGVGDELARNWMERVKKANVYYEQWEQRSKSQTMEQYYECEQWEGTGTNYEPYVINLVFATIEIKLPTLLFSNPIFHVKPKPFGSYQYDIDTAVKKALLKEDVLNTIVTDGEMDFAGEIELCILDAFFRFGIVEVGYSTDWILNPNAGKPILKSDSEEVVYDYKQNVVKQPEKLPENERIYAKRIPANHFRVGGIDGARLDRCNWCGYWEFVRVEDLRANKTLKNVDSLDWSGARSADFLEDDWENNLSDLSNSGDLIKIWHIWDIRKKKRMLFADPQGVTLYEKEFKRLPLFDLRFHRKTKGWYPLPPARNWKPMQDEQNEAKEQARNHRKRFNRKFTYDGAAFDSEEEIDKMVNGGDGVFSKCVPGKNKDAVVPVSNAQLGPEGLQLLQLTKADFDIVAGSSNQERGQQDSGTATEANIINQKASVRDSRQRIQVANWLMDIGKEMLLLAEEKFTNPFWVKFSNSDENFGALVQEQQTLWHQISANDLGMLGDGRADFEVTLSIDSMSPITNDDEKKSLMEFLAMLNQFPEVSMDPLLVRELAYRCNYRNEKVIARMQKVAQMMLINKMKSLEGAGGAAGGPAPNQAGQAIAAQNTPNNMEQIRNQIQQQVKGGMVQ